MWWIWTEWLDGDTLSRECILGMGSEIMFPKESKRVSRGTSSLLPRTVIVLLPYLQQEAFHYFGSALYWVVRLTWLVLTETHLFLSETELIGSYCRWTDWFLLIPNWLVPTASELTGSYLHQNDWFQLRLNWLVPTETEMTGSYCKWTDWFLVQVNWLVPSTSELTGSYWYRNDWYQLRLNWLVPIETELTVSYCKWTDWFLLIYYCLLCCACHCVMLLSLCCSVDIMLYSYCVALLLFVLSYVLIVCTVPLPPSVNPIAVDKYIISYRNDWYQLRLNWLVPTDTELIGSSWDWTDWCTADGTVQEQRGYTAAHTSV